MTQQGHRRRTADLHDPMLHDALVGFMVEPDQECRFVQASTSLRSPSSPAASASRPHRRDVRTAEPPSLEVQRSMQQRQQLRFHIGHVPPFILSDRNGNQRGPRALSFCLSLGLWPSTAIPLRGQRESCRRAHPAPSNTLLLRGYTEPLIDFLIRNPLVIEGPEQNSLA